MTTTMGLFSKIILYFTFLSIVIAVPKCKEESKFYVHNFLGYDLKNFFVPCIYSGYIQIPNLNVFFVLIKSQVSKYETIPTFDQPLIVWINEPGKSSLKSILTEGTIFRFRENLSLEYQFSNAMSNAVDMLFVDYPGETGLSQGFNFTTLAEIKLGFNQFIKGIHDTELLNVEKQHLFFLGHSYLLPHLAKSLKMFADLKVTVKKVGLINSILDSRVESDARADLAKGLAILSLWDEPEYDSLKARCEFEHYNNLESNTVCEKLNEFLIKTSGDVSLTDSRRSIYKDNAIDDIISKLMNDENHITNLNVNAKDSKKSNGVSWMDSNPEVRAAIKTEKSGSNYHFDHKEFDNEDFHIFFLSGQFNLEYGSHERIINLLVPALEKESKGYWKIPIDPSKLNDPSSIQSRTMIKGFIKQSDNYSYLLFKEAGKYIGESDPYSFSYFIKHFFLNPNSSNVPCLDDSSVELPMPVEQEEFDPDEEEFRPKQNLDNNNNSWEDPENRPIEIIDDWDQVKSDISTVINIGKGGCIDYMMSCKMHMDCNNNGYCDDSTKGRCNCNHKFYGPSCSHEEEPLLDSTTMKISSSDVRVFTPQNSFNFVISGNLLFEIESDNPNIVVSIINKQSHQNIFDYTKHLYYQILETKKIQFYLDNKEVQNVLIVVSNIDSSKEIGIKFNICNFQTHIVEFFGPGGLGFTLALIFFLIGLASYIATYILHKPSSNMDELVYHKQEDKPNSKELIQKSIANK